MRQQLPGSKEKILQCAREMLYQIGYQSTSVDDILQQTGVAKSNFYYHFKTKDDLVLAVLELQADEYRNMILESLRNPELTAHARLELFFEQICHGQKSVRKMAGCPFGNFAAALPNAPEDERIACFRRRLSVLFREMEIALQECLADGIEQGCFRNDIASYELAGFLVASMEGLLILTKTHQDTGPLLEGFKVVQQLLRVL